jgi:anti-sigma B factor antagonist
MNEAGDVQVTIEHRGNAVIVQPAGEIDLGSSVSLRQYLRQVQAGNPERVIIDLQEVPYMDSSGVATLVEAMQAARRANRSLILCGLQQRVRSVFEIAKLDMVFTIVENADIAHSA